MATDQLEGKPTELSLQAETRRSPDFVLGGFCFLSALLASIYIQFSNTQPRMLLMLDSGHFFLTCQLLCKQIFDLFLLRLQPNNFLGDCLMQDGVVLPLIPAILYSLLGIEPLSTNWQVVAIVQCFYHAVSATLVYLISARLLKSTRWALLAGVIWGLNPAALVNCGRFLTEGLALVLILASVYMMVEAIKNADRPVKRLAFGGVSGLFQGLVLLTKPPLIFACVLSSVLSWSAFTSFRQRTQFVGSLIVGAALVMLPWAVATKQLIGEVHIVPKRCAVHNLVKGLNYQADAWQSFPLPPLTALYTNWFGYESGLQELWSVGQAVVSASPLESVFLAARKIPRLFFLPWNDFDTRVGILSPESQVLWHYFLVASSMLGMIGFVLGKNPSVVATNDRIDRISGYVCLAVVLGHFAYLPFEAMPRYWFSAMPFVVIFAVFFWCYASTSRERLLPLSLLFAYAAIVLNSFDLLPYTISIVNTTWGGLFLEFFIKATLVLACLGTLFYGLAERNWSGLTKPARFLMPVFAFCCLFILWASTYTHKLPREWRCVLVPGQVATRSVYLDKAKTEIGRAYLIFDTDKSVSNAKFLVNGYPINGDPFPIYQLREDQFPVSGFVRTFASAKGLQFEDIRQWRVLPVPVSVIRSGAVNSLSIKANGLPVTVYGDFELESESRRYPPKFFDFSPDKFIHDPFRKDGRLINYVGVPVVKGSSKVEVPSLSDSRDLSPSPGMQTGEFRIFLATQRPERALAVESKSETESIPLWWKKRILPEDFDPLLVSPDGLKAGEVRMNKSILKFCKSNSSTIHLPGELKERLKACKSFYVFLKGKVRSAVDSESIAGICVTLQGRKTIQIIPSTPYALESKGQWSEFVLKDRVPSGQFLDGIDSIVLGLYPGPWEQIAAYGPSKRSGDSIFKELVLEIQADNESYIHSIHDLCVK